MLCVISVCEILVKSLLIATVTLVYYSRSKATLFSIKNWNLTGLSRQKRNFWNSYLKKTKIETRCDGLTRNQNGQPNDPMLSISKFEGFNKLQPTD